MGNTGTFMDFQYYFFLLKDDRVYKYRTNSDELYQYEYAGEKVERNDKKQADDNLEDASIGIIEK
jgi:hypothetical protein